MESDCLENEPFLAVVVASAAPGVEPGSPECRPVSHQGSRETSSFIFYLLKAGRGSFFIIVTTPLTEVVKVWKSET